MQSFPTFALLGAMLAGLATPVRAEETTGYALDFSVKALSDGNNRGVSESLGRPAIQAEAQFAHESGLIAVAQIASNSKKVFTGGDGYSLLLGLGYRFGDTDAWHFGVGLAAERFPGAGFDAPHAFDMETGLPADFRKTRYDTSYLALEIGWGALEGRIINVISRNYRGADTGGVCAQLLVLSVDPAKALDCYARGDRDSRGSWLFDLDYKLPLNDRTTLKLHAGTQRIRHFSELNYSDYAIGLQHLRWGIEWSADYVVPRTRVREMFQAADDGGIRAADKKRLVLAISRKF